MICDQGIKLKRSCTRLMLRRNISSHSTATHPYIDAIVTPQWLVLRLLKIAELLIPLPASESRIVPVRQLEQTTNDIT